MKPLKRLIGIILLLIFVILWIPIYIIFGSEKVEYIFHIIDEFISY